MGNTLAITKYHSIIEKDWDHKVNVAKQVLIPHDDNGMEVANDGSSELSIGVPNVTEVDDTVDNTENYVEQLYYGSDPEGVAISEPDASDEEEGSTSQAPVLPTTTSLPSTSSLPQPHVVPDTATVISCNYPGCFYGFQLNTCIKESCQNVLHHLCGEEFTREKGLYQGDDVNDPGQDQSHWCFHCNCNSIMDTNESSTTVPTPSVDEPTRTLTIRGIETHELTTATSTSQAVGTGRGRGRGTGRGLQSGPVRKRPWKI